MTAQDTLNSTQKNEIKQIINSVILEFTDDLKNKISLVRRFLSDTIPHIKSKMHKEQKTQVNKHSNNLKEDTRDAILLRSIQNIPDETERNTITKAIRMITSEVKQRIESNIDKLDIEFN